MRLVLVGSRPSTEGVSWQLCFSNVPRGSLVGLNSAVFAHGAALARSLAQGVPAVSSSAVNIGASAAPDEPAGALRFLGAFEGVEKVPEVLSGAFRPRKEKAGHRIVAYT